MPSSASLRGQALLIPGLFLSYQGIFSRYYYLHAMLDLGGRWSVPANRPIPMENHIVTKGWR